MTSPRARAPIEGTLAVMAALALASSHSVAGNPDTKGKPALATPAATPLCATGMNYVPEKAVPKGSSYRDIIPDILGKYDGAFCIDHRAVTYSDYRKCVSSGRCKALAKYGKARAPVVVTKKQAKNYCSFQGKRLPTSHEWLIATQAEIANVVYACTNLRARRQAPDVVSFKVDTWNAAAREWVENDPSVSWIENDRYEEEVTCTYNLDDEHRIDPAGKVAGFRCATTPASTQ